MSLYKLMIVEDEIPALEFVENIVDYTQHGFELVCTARNAAEGKQLFAQFHPDLIITDVVMPGENGVDMLMEIKEESPDTMAILLTGYNEFEYARQGIEIGVKAYLLKHELTEEAMGKQLDAVREALNVIHLRQQQDLMNQILQSDTGTPDTEQVEKIIHALNEIRNQYSVRYSTLIANVMQYVEAHIEESIKLSDVAKEVYVHPVYLSQKFKSEVGINFKTYVTRKKIEKAEELLRTQKYKVYEISDILGFGSIQHFSYTFKQIKGYSPAELLRQKAYHDEKKQI